MKKKRKNKRLINPNKVIDLIFHPLFREDKSFVIIDGALHFIVEQNLSVSAKKFAKYSLRHLL